MSENSDTLPEVQEDTSQVQNVDNLDMASLRKYAKLLNIGASRDWDKNDYINAIKEKQSNKTRAKIVFDNGNAPAPGYVRIIMNRDPTPGHANSPVQVGVNGDLLHIPRGIPVDIPEAFVKALFLATTKTNQQIEAPSNANPTGTFRNEDTVSYPFQIQDSTAGGKWKARNDNRSANYALRASFEKTFGRWPTAGELEEAMKAKIIRDTR